MYSSRPMLCARPARGMSIAFKKPIPIITDIDLAQLTRSVATMSHRQLHGWILLPLVMFIGNLSHRARNVDPQKNCNRMLAFGVAENRIAPPSPWCWSAGRRRFVILFVRLGRHAIVILTPL